MPNGGALAIETAEVELGEGASVGYLQARPGRYVRLTVSDTGVGMTSSVKEHLFEPFFTTKPIGKGTGLGLPAAYGIVEEWGGCIDVTSEPGHGATFRIYLPRLGSGPQAVAPRPPSPAMQGSEAILVVEDDDAVRALLAQGLRRLGYTVLEARDGEEALLMCRGQEGAIDLVLTDLIMPHLNGPELVAQLGQGERGPRVAYMTGHAEDAIDSLGPLAEDVPLIRKPFTMETIAHVVRSTLDARRTGGL
jgi:two-component system cell cycle sensor histidine kinase/response regulator CckA